jgi:hypothetical protein
MLSKTLTGVLKPILLIDEHHIYGVDPADQLSRAMRCFD